MNKLWVLAYILLWLAAMLGGVAALSMDEAWGWFLLAPAGVILLFIHTANLLDDMTRGPRLPFATRENWIGIRGFASGFALAIAIWAGTTEGTAGRVIAAICVSIIGLCVYAGAFSRGR